MIETLVRNPEFEQNLPSETERKFIPIFPLELEEFRTSARPVEQFYLSHPSEPYGLRLRESFSDDGELLYTATLKSRGEMHRHGIHRMEVEVPISQELYLRYRTPEVPLVRKLRATPNKHVAIDFFEDGAVRIESEHPIAWAHFVEQYGDNFVEVTGDRVADNEWQAHLAYRRQNDGAETLAPNPDLDPQAIVQAILREYTKTSAVVIQISGRSGSGKSTIVRQIQQELQRYGLPCTTLSTDDYHRGASWLKQYNNGEDWTKWDDAVVYDTDALAADIERLKIGETIPRRTINFATVEPEYQGEITPVPIIIVEGLYALDPKICAAANLQFVMPTSLATCIGRRITRDAVERPQFTPESNLRYTLEHAEPMYQQQLQSSASREQTA